MQRIQKFLADLGFGSRRKIEGWIDSKKLKVNGQLVELGLKVNGSEEFTLEDKILLIDQNRNNHSNKNQEIKVILYNKPTGKICTRSDPKNRPTVFEDLPELKCNRWVAVGRLDFNTSGLLLFTNNGELANKLMHPSYNQEREYLVRILGQLSKQGVSCLKKGIKLPEGIAKFKEIEFVKQQKANSWYKVILTEGKNKEVKRLFASQGLLVSRLIRIRFGNILLPQNLKPGKFQYLDYSYYFLNQKSRA